MFRSLCLALWAFVSFTVASPIPKLDTNLIPRSESGPKIGGANFPDPCVIEVGGTWYAFATRTIGSSVHIQIASSSDFNTWSIVENSDGSQKDALPTLPAWVDSSSWNTWAPSVDQLADGKFIMYFAASTSQSTSQHCVGAAIANNVEGPYVPTSSSALICPLSQGGAIDATGYSDGGARYIVYKIDGNSIGHGGACDNTDSPIVPTPLMLQAVAADGVTLLGNPQTLLNNDGASDGGGIEAPALIKSGSTYYLFFSSGCFTQSTYTVSYATSTSGSIWGPYTREGVLFQTGTDGLTSPGGADIYKDGSHAVFHANQGSGRALYTAQLTFNGNSVSA